MSAAGAEPLFTLLIDGLETWRPDDGQMARHPRRWSKRSRTEPKPLWVVGTGAFAITFAGGTYVLAPDAPGKAELREQWTRRTTDQHYSGCDQARANNHENIASWEPSYRGHMDGDGDGLACEPYP
jgi:hypothetical protein